MEWVDVDKCLRDVIDLFKVGAGKKPLNINVLIEEKGIKVILQISS